MALAIHTVSKGSSLTDNCDPITSEHFKPGDQIVLCPQCHTPHLTGSWEYNQLRCTILGCSGNGTLTPETTQSGIFARTMSHVSPVVMSAGALQRSEQSSLNILARLLQGVYVVLHTLLGGGSVLILGITFLIDLCAGVPALPEITIALGLVIGGLLCMIIAAWFGLYFGYALSCQVAGVAPIPVIDLVDPGEYPVLVVLGWIGGGLLGLLSCATTFSLLSLLAGS